MVEKEKNDIPHVMVNPDLILREFADSLGEFNTEQLTIGDAKRAVLHYAMLNTVTYVLAGANSSDNQMKINMFKGAADWLEKINKTNENDWSGLINEVRTIGMIIEDGWIGGNEKTPEVIYKMVELIEASQTH